MLCQQCQCDARFKGYAEKTCVSLLGPIQIARPHYACDACGASCYPWDDTLRLTARKLTPAAAEVCALAGTLGDFASGRRALAKLSGLRVGESTVERATEDAGRKLAAALDAGEVFEPATPWEWTRDAEGKRCGYIAVDGIFVLMQGERGAKADARLEYVGRLYNPPPRGEPPPQETPLDEALAEARPPTKPPDSRYVGGFHTLQETSEHLQQHAQHVGGEAVERWICLTDAGNGIAAALQRAFCWVVWILDFWHAAEYLKPLGQAMHPSDEERRKTWLQTWCHALKHEGGAPVLARLQALDLSCASAAAREAHAKVVQYYTNHLEGMDYPTYCRKGWQIGSGPVESGMRWGEDGANTLSHLRALFLNGAVGWDHFWGDN